MRAKRKSPDDGARGGGLDRQGSVSAARAQLLLVFDGLPHCQHGTPWEEPSGLNCSLGSSAPFDQPPWKDENC